MNGTASRSGLAAVALVAIAACSAANGANGNSTVPGLTPAAGTATNPDRRHKRPPNQKKQRSLATAALSVAGASVDLDQFGSQGGLLSTLLHFGHSVAKTHKPKPHDGATPTCKNGVEYSWSSAGFGQVDQTIEFFTTPRARSRITSSRSTPRSRPPAETRPARKKRGIKPAL